MNAPIFSLRLDQKLDGGHQHYLLEPKISARRQSQIMKKILTTIATTASLLTAASDAAVLAQYNFTGSSDATSDADANSLATSLGIGTLGTEFGALGTNHGFSTATVVNSGSATASSPVRFVRNDFTAGVEATAITNNDYFKFTLTPGATFQANLTSLFFDYSANGSGTLENTASFFVRSSADGFAANVGTTASATITGSAAADYQRQTIDLSGAAFQNLTAPIEFRVYVTNSGVGVARLDNLTLNGDIAAIPEPSSLALLGSLGALALRRRR
jgi:hypothetical protein